MNINHPQHAGSPRRLRMLVFSLVVCCFGLPSLPAHAQDSTDTERKVAQLQQRLVEVQRESQLRLEALQRQTDEQMQALRQQIVQLTREVQGSGATIPSPEAPAEVAGELPEGLAEPPAESSPDTGKEAGDTPWDRLDVFGDFRLRYEANSSDGPIPSWDREVLRARLGARYQLGDPFSIGARLVTGDPDNPRTTDVTIGNFDDNFDVSLDLAYANFTYHDLFLTGGKFAKPFSSTELVWDGDVNLQGAGGYYTVFDNDAWAAQFTAVYFLINQSILEQGSDMVGGQFSQDFNIHENWNLSFDLAYYDYDIGLLNPQVPGGARGNNIAHDGVTYLSDFNLLDMIGSATYSGFGERWNINLLGDYVKNLGAEVAEDSGYEFDLFVGNLAQPGRFLIHYGYAQAETDAVLGLFSNDNIVYPTNYEMHTFSIDYALREHTFLGLTNYMYRHLQPDPESPFDNDWVFRTRLNLYFVF